MNSRFLFFIISVVCVLLVTGCSSTKSTKSKSKWNITNITMGNCQGRTHPERLNVTADYHACSHNNNDITEDVDRCMLQQGWSEKKDIECEKVNKFYTQKEINSCLSQSKNDNLIDNEEMNSCLSNFSEVKRSDKEIKHAIEELLSDK